jgi:hypothetical protein
MNSNLKNRLDWLGIAAETLDNFKDGTEVSEV